MQELCVKPALQSGGVLVSGVVVHLIFGLLCTRKCNGFEDVMHLVCKWLRGRCASALWSGAD